jgi:O-acetyl-ADP-ribose deacetylase (regulator of RNase III)
MKTIRGDLITLAKEGEFDVIIHGCNCFNTMGAGIAVSISQHFEEAYLADLRTMKGDRFKLGTYTGAKIERYQKPFVVINAYTQYGYRSAGIHLDYDALRSSFENIVKKYGNKNLKFGIPKIGAGLAGGDWKKIKSIIEEIMKDEDITVVEFDKGAFYAKR